MVGATRCVGTLLRAGSLIGVLLAAAPSAARPERCRVKVEVMPGHAVVGQRITWIATIERRGDVRDVDWRSAPRFPGFRAEWLPGELLPDPVGTSGWRAGLERRALFAARAGVHLVPPASLDCDGRPVEVPGVRVGVEALPEAGRPADFSGLVGPLRVTSRLVPERVALGESARLWVVVRGGGNVWRADAPLDEDALPHVDVFPDPPTLDVESDREISVRRTFRYQLVPRREGAVRIPAVRYAWFDPETRRYRSAQAPERTLTVGGTAILGER